MQHERRCSRARRKDVSFRDVKIKIPERYYDRRMWMTSSTGSVRGGFGGFWEKVRELSFSIRRRRLTFGSHRGLAAGAAQGAGRWKSQHRKIVYHYPNVENPFNSKVKKSFVPELRSSKCFSCFGIPILSIHELWTFYVYFTYSCMGMLQLYDLKQQFLFYNKNLETIAASRTCIPLQVFQSNDKNPK